MTCPLAQPGRLRPSRTLRWVSSIDPSHRPDLERLAETMAEYYRSNAEYYADIDFTANNWRDDITCRFIAGELASAARMLEVGCGRANLLRQFPDWASRYAGCDFSRALLDHNAITFPAARFHALEAQGQLPFSNGGFDAVFSIFVLEHCVFPHGALEEWTRNLRVGGRLLVLCPDFLGEGRMSSQRAGYSAGTARVKLKRGAWWDAVVTLWDNRLRIPWIAARRRRLAASSPQFLVNLAPTCFTDPFEPDVDAVYVTCEAEMRNFFAGRIRWREHSPALVQELRKKRLILLDGDRMN